MGVRLRVNRPQPAEPSEPRNPNTQPDTSTAEAGLYQALMAHTLYQDRLAWDVSQLLIAVQGAVLASSFTLRSHWLGIAILLFGATLTFILLALATKHELDRDVNRNVMDKLANHLLSEVIKEELRHEGKSEPFVRFSASRPRWFIIRGRYILRGVLLVFILIDIIFAGVFRWASYLLPQ
jgi:hypothetical protein